MLFRYPIHGGAVFLYIMYNAIKNWDEDDRPREKAIKHGIDKLSTAELLAIIIGSGNKNKSALDVARDLWNRCDKKVENICQLSYDDLLKIDAIGQAKAVSIMAAIELGRRRESQNAVRESITCSEDIFNIFGPMLRDKKHEVAYEVLLDNANHIISYREISSGGTSYTIIDAKIVLRDAILASATGVVIIHNHPSGNVSPSEMDKRITESIRSSCKLMDIRFLDHLIIGGNTYYSFVDNGR